MGSLFLFPLSMRDWQRCGGWSFRFSARVWLSSFAIRWLGYSMMSLCTEWHLAIGQFEPASIAPLIYSLSSKYCHGIWCLEKNIVVKFEGQLICPHLSCLKQHKRIPLCSAVPSHQCSVCSTSVHSENRPTNYDCEFPFHALSFNSSVSLSFLFQTDCAVPHCLFIHSYNSLYSFFWFIVSAFETRGLFFYRLSLFPRTYAPSA